MPVEWTRWRLGDYSSIDRGLSYSSSELTGAGVPMVNLKSFCKGGGYRPDGIKSYSGYIQPEYMLHGGELIIANTDLTRDGSVVGVPALVPLMLNGQCAAFSMDVSRISLDERVADARFLYYRMQLQDVRSFMQARAAGSTVLHLHLQDIPSLQLELPPTTEQRRIAEILDTLDEAIRQTEQVIAKLQQMKQGLLHDLLTRGIDENGELRDPERHPEQFKDSPLGRIPRGWKIKCLAETAEVRTGIAKNKNKAVSNPVLVHYLRVANVQDGFLDLSEMSHIRVASEDVEKYSVKWGDVLMNEGGDLDKLGRGGIWLGEYEPCVHQNHVFVVRCGTELLPEFLHAWRGSPAARKYFIIAGKQTTNLASINSTALGGLPVVVPHLREQGRIIDVVRLHAESLALEARELAKLRTLKAGLMDDLLTGRARVTLEADEEPR